MFERDEISRSWKVEPRWLMAVALWWAIVPLTWAQAQVPATPPAATSASKAAESEAKDSDAKGPKAKDAEGKNVVAEAKDVPEVQDAAKVKETAASESKAPASEESNELSPEEVQQYQAEYRQKLTGLESSGLAEEDRRLASEFYQKAIDALGSWEEHWKLRKFHEKEASEYKDDLKEFQDKLASLAEEDAVFEFDADVATLEQQLAVQEQLVQAAQAELAKSEKQPKNRQTRLAEIPQLMVERQQELEKVTAEHAEVADTDATDVLANAERNFLWSRARALEMSLEEMERQRQYFSLSPDLVQVRRDYRAKFLAQEEKRLTALREAIDERRLAEAEEQASEAAAMAAVERPEAIAKLAKQNAKLAEKQAEIAAKNTTLTNELAQVATQRDNLVKEFTRSEENVKAATTEASGQQLRQQQELLPDSREISRRIALRTQEREDITYESFELINRRSAIVDADVDERIAKTVAEIPIEQRAAAEKEVRELLDAELKILDSTIEAYDSYSLQLAKLSAAEDQLRVTAQEYSDLIAENVLWIRSTSLPRLADIAPAAEAFAWSWSPVNWRAALAALWTKAGDSPLVVAFFGAVMGFALYMHQRLRSRLRVIGEAVAKRTSADFWPSLEALWITLLLALPWPGLLGFVGWWMDSPLNESEFVRALSTSLQFTALCMLLLELVRHLCRSAGLADAHFNWPQSCLLQVRRHIRWLIWICLPLVLWLTSLEVQNVERLWSSTLGRACFVTVMLVLAFVSYRVLQSRRSPFRQLLMNNSDTASPRLFHIWAPAATVLPVLLAILAIIGYYYTAQKLSVQLLQTAGIVLALLVVGGMTKRWILINRRRLAREQAKQKRAQVAAAAAANAAGDETPAIPVAELMEDSVDLVALGEQTSKLVFTILVVVGLVSAWFVWSEMLPALSSLERWVIFPREDVKNALTWGALLRFGLVLVVSFVVVRNVPALLEFAVLQRLPLDNGSRYAITSISRYVLVTIGIATAYSTLGFDGTSIQWLVAAMGVGLGFGLQEIFANFVSGIILLFERPIRVGDIVTLGEKTGVVSRIRMRATTILDPDRKEYIVPNKDLITERLLNWTLSDPTNRIVINVGIAYGSDTEQACQLLREAALEHPVVLREPEPNASLEGFGASTLDLALRCFLPNVEKRLQTIHELNSAINKKFAAAGLEMAYPQTDVYVKSWPERWPKPGVRAIATNGQANGQDKEAQNTHENGKHS